MIIQLPDIGKASSGVYSLDNDSYNWCSCDIVKSYTIVEVTVLTTTYSRARLEQFDGWIIW